MVVVVAVMVVVAVGIGCVPSEQKIDDSAPVLRRHSSTVHAVTACARISACNQRSCVGKQQPTVHSGASLQRLPCHMPHRQQQQRWQHTCQFTACIKACVSCQMFAVWCPANCMPRCTSAQTASCASTTIAAMSAMAACTCTIVREAKVQQHRYNHAAVQMHVNPVCFMNGERWLREVFCVCTYVALRHVKVATSGDWT